MEVDVPFLKSTKGLLKTAEMACCFVALVCFSAASRPPYVSAACLELIITSGLLLLYLLKLNKTLTFLFWPLIDVFNSVFAGVWVFIVALVVVSSYTLTSALIGGVWLFLASVCWSLDGFLLSRIITFNRPRATGELN